MRGLVVVVGGGGGDVGGGLLMIDLSKKFKTHIYIFLFHTAPHIRLILTYLCLQKNIFFIT